MQTGDHSTMEDPRVGRVRVHVFRGARGSGNEAYEDPDLGDGSGSSPCP